MAGAATPSGLVYDITSSVSVSVTVSVNSTVVVDAAKTQ